MIHDSDAGIETNKTTTMVSQSIMPKYIHTELMHKCIIQRL